MTCAHGFSEVFRFRYDRVKTPARVPLLSNLTDITKLLFSSKTELGSSRVIHSHILKNSVLITKFHVSLFLHTMRCSLISRLEPQLAKY